MHTDSVVRSGTRIAVVRSLTTEVHASRTWQLLKIFMNDHGRLGYFVVSFVASFVDAKV